MKKRKLLALLLVLCFVFSSVSLLSSCSILRARFEASEKNDAENEDVQGGGDTVTGDTDNGGGELFFCYSCHRYHALNKCKFTSLGLYGYYLHAVEGLDYKGEVFNILVPQSTERILSRDFATQYSEKGSNVIQDAAYDRVLEVNNLYKTDIRATVTSGSVYAQAQADFEGRLCNYDLILCEMNRIASLATRGFLSDLKQFDGEEIQLDAPWYNQNYVDNMSIGGRLYGVVGDFSLMDNEGIMAIQFNMDLFDRYDFGNPYTFVYNGEWTVDKMHELCKGRVVDSDGSGDFSQQDTFGFIANFAAVNNLMIGTQSFAVKKDVDDRPILSLDSSRALGVLENVLALFRDQTASADLSEIASDSDFSDVYTYSNFIFSQGHTFMRLTPMYAAAQSISVDFDFGYLPMPKYDVNQEQYYHLYENTAPAVCIPAYLKEGRTAWGNAAVMEAISYLGRAIIRDQYYDIVLKPRIALDRDTRKMLDIIFDASYTDFAAAYNFGNVNGIYNASVSSGENSFMRDYNAVRSAAEAEMRKFVDGWSHILSQY